MRKLLWSKRFCNEIETMGNDLLRFRNLFVTIWKRFFYLQLNEMFVLKLTVGKATFQTGNWCCMALNLLLENHCTGSPDLGTASEKRGQNATKSVWVDALVLILTSAVAVGIINWLTGIRYALNRLIGVSPCSRSFTCHASCFDFSNSLNLTFSMRSLLSNITYIYHL